MGSIPVTMIKKNFHINVGDCVYVCSGDHDDRRRSRDYEMRGADVDIDLYSGRCLFHSPEGEEHPEKGNPS